MRNYPKVLPKYPNPYSEYVSSSSFKRRSMPSYQHMINTYARPPPVPPPRTTSTLDRMGRHSDGVNRGEPWPLMPVMAEPIPESPSEEPETIEIAALHVGPLLPGSKENLYSTINRKKFLMDEQKPCLVAAQIETPSETKFVISSDEKHDEKSGNDATTETYSQPKSIMKRPFMRQNSGDSNSTNGTPTQVLSTSSKIPVLSRFSTSTKSNSSNASNSNSDSKSSSDPSTDDSTKDLVEDLTRSEASIASVETYSSAETIKQIF